FVHLVMRSLRFPRDRRNHIFLGQALQQHFLIVSFMVSNFFVLIMKRVQHRHKEVKIKAAQNPP
ncbi:MAG: hypothetical protein WBD99_12775, partial [Thermodesulfobacteriota bacterium]